MPTYFLQSDPANPPPGLNAKHLVETEMVGESSLTPYICAQGMRSSLYGVLGCDKLPCDVIDRIGCNQWVMK